MDWFYLLEVQGTLKSLLQHCSSEASICLWYHLFLQNTALCGGFLVDTNVHKAMRSAQRRLARGEGETGHPATLPRKQSRGYMEQPVGLCWAPSALSSCLGAWLGWKLKPKGSSAVPGCNYFRRTEFLWVPDFQIRQSRKLSRPTSPQCPSSPQKESFLSSCTDTNSLSQWRAYPCWSRPPLCQLPALSENKEREEELGTSARCHIHMHNWINNLQFANSLNELLHEHCPENSIRVNLQLTQWQRILTRDMIFIPSLAWQRKWYRELYNQLGAPLAWTWRGTGWGSRKADFPSFPFGVLYVLGIPPPAAGSAQGLQNARV